MGTSNWLNDVVPVSWTTFPIVPILKMTTIFYIFCASICMTQDGLFFLRGPVIIHSPKYNLSSASTEALKGKKQKLVIFLYKTNRRVNNPLTNWRFA